jgi:imidazolonepropionase-like amidohydrolase
MANVLFTNVRIIDGSGAMPYAGEVLVQGNRIARVARGSRTLPTVGVTVIDGAGATLMPGMVEAHTHFSWNDAATLMEIQLMPLEEHVLWAANVARRYLQAGWTSCVGAACAKPRLDVVVRNAINEGLIPGPRYLAASQEITVAGGLGDETLPHIPWPEFSFGVVVSGPDEMRRAVRMFLKYGVDSVKLNLSGDNFVANARAETTWMTDEEVAVAVREAKMRGKRVAAHARSCESIKQCVRHGIEVIYHASFTDEEALDLLEANKDRHFVAPGIAILHAMLHEAEPWGITHAKAVDMGYQVEWDAAIESLRGMHKRGIRVLPGGDYGFAFTPHCQNARDLEFFVRYLGMTPMEALLSATKYGAQIMMKGDELGQVKDGYLADLLLVDGDPLASLAILREPSRMLAVMKDGTFYKEPEIRSARTRWGQTAA